MWGSGALYGYEENIGLADIAVAFKVRCDSFNFAWYDRSAAECVLADVGVATEARITPRADHPPLPG
jgi:hypothetical protein